MYVTYSVAGWKKKHHLDHQLKFNITKIQFSVSVSDIMPHPSVQTRNLTVTSDSFLSYMQVSDLSNKSMNHLFPVHWPPICIKPYKIYFQKHISSGLQKKVWKGEKLCLGIVKLHDWGGFVWGQKLDSNICKPKRLCRSNVGKLSALCLFWPLHWLRCFIVILLADEYIQKGLRCFFSILR